MKNKGILVPAILGVAVSGCIDWEAFERANKDKNGGSSGRVNATAASEIQKRIENNVPSWDVYLTTDRSGADVVEAIPRDSSGAGAVLLGGSAEAERAFEKALSAGHLSLLDMLAIADEIEQKRYRLGAPTEGAGGEGRGFGSHSRGARAFASTSESSLVRQVHDALLRHVRERVSAGSCQNTCTGNYAACSNPTARAFAKGVPCRVGKDSTTSDFTKKYGRTWCTDAFCPAMQNVVEGWREGP